MRKAPRLEPEDLLSTADLYRRPARSADLESELAAYRELSALMAIDPLRAIQRFLDLAVELCPAAGSAGLSELTSDSDGDASFEWTAMSGAFAPYVGGTTPRNFSPCGLCLDSHHTILVDRPARVFTYFNDAEPPIVEGLIVPLYDTGKRPIGTLWVTSHRDDLRFDATDARIMEQLAVQLVLAIKLRRKALIAAKLKETARDNEVLVHEVRHRVKNVIQMATSLLHLQERDVESVEARTALSEARNRLLALSAVYDSLLHPDSDARFVDVGDLIGSLARALCDGSTARSRVTLRTECDPEPLAVSSAIPLGLIVNEGVTNALKHAFPEGTTGEILIRFTSGTDGCSLIIADDGAGFSLPPREGSLGMRLMTSLARQLGANLHVDGGSGTTVRLDWNTADAAAVSATLQPATV